MKHKPELTAYSLQIPVDTMRAVRLRAAREGVTPAEWVREAVRLRLAMTTENKGKK